MVIRNSECEPSWSSLITTCLLLKLIGYMHVVMQWDEIPSNFILLHQIIKSLVHSIQKKKKKRV